MEVKTIGASGQISLGKEYAGRTVVVDEFEPGVWMIKTAQIIPDNERWLHEPEFKERLDRAIGWAEQHAAAPSNVERFIARMKRRKARRS